MTPSIGNAEIEADTEAAKRKSKRTNPMLDWLKTSSGAYNLQFIIAMIGWLIGGAALIAGFHLNKVKTIEAEAKARKAETDRTEIAAKLETANAKTAELEKKLAPRQLTPQQRKQFISAVADAPKGPITVVYSNPQPETIAFATQIRSLFIEAGFEVSAPPEYTLAFTIDPPAPWFISLVAVLGTEPPYAQAIHHAWRAIGVENGFTNGIQFAKPGELKIYIGSK